MEQYRNIWKRKIISFFGQKSVWLFIFALAIYSICLNGLWETDHTTSFLQLAWAIYEHHSFALGSAQESLLNNSSNCQTNPIACSVDDFSFNGRYFAAAAPGTAILILPLAVAGFITQQSFSVFGPALAYSEFVVALTNAFATVLIYKIGRFYFQDKIAAFLSLAYAFSTISWPFATMIFQSDPSSAFDLLCVFFALKASRNRNPKDFFVSGLALTVSFTIDYMNLVLVPIVFLYLWFSIRKSGLSRTTKSLAGFSVAALLGIVLIGVYDYVNFGNALRTSELLYGGGGAIWGSFTEPLLNGLALNLFSPYRGLFFYSPILILGVYGTYKMLRARYYGDGLFFLCLFLGILFPYSMWYSVSGGLSYGPRFLVSAIPYILIPAGFGIKFTHKENFLVLSYLLYVVGCVTNGLAALTSATAPVMSQWYQSPFLYWTLPLFNASGFDSWLITSGYFNNQQFLFVVTVVLLAVVLAPNLFGFGSEPRLKGKITPPDVGTISYTRDPGP